MKVVSVTGHRPEKLGGYSDDAQLKLIKFTKSELQKLTIDKIITGMAIGFDQATAISAIELQIPVIAAIPFAGQEKFWPKESRDLYRSILNNSLVESFIVCPGGFQPWKMQKRNEWMVDNSDLILALYNGDKNGGTKNCIEYAKRKNKEIINIWENWVQYEEN